MKAAGWILVGWSLAMPGGVRAEDPSPEDQAAIQAVLKRYLKGLNECDWKAVAGASDKLTARSFGGFAVGITTWLNPTEQNCGEPRFAMELTALARSVDQWAPTVATADGFFRTQGHPGGEKVGRVVATVLKGAAGWKLTQFRLFASAMDLPLVAVKPAEKHDEPGPDGWVTLFDGKDAEAFLEAGGRPFPASWKVENGLLEAVRATNRNMPSNALRTRDTYRNFELRFEWKVAERGNSGIKYHLFYLVSYPTFSDAAGLEYQIVDEEGDPGAKRFAVERAGSLYNQIAPVGAKPKPLGEFNESVIIVKGKHREHWLNGVKVVEYESESGPPEGPILIQHHQTGAAFRLMKIRRLD